MTLEKIEQYMKNNDSYLRIESIINKYSNNEKYPNFDNLILKLKKLTTGSKKDLEQDKYDFVPISSKKKKCMYCYRYPTISSHSISNSQLNNFSPSKEVYKINTRNTLVTFNALLRSINKEKIIKANSILFSKIANSLASTFPGFCGSDHKNHDFDLFHNIDGHNGIENINEFIWESLYRIISWKICKYEVEVELYIFLNTISEEFDFFVSFWTELLNIQNEVKVRKSYFKEQKNICLDNIKNLTNKIHALKKIKEENQIYLVQNRHFLFIEPIDKPNYMGMNYFCSYNKVRQKWFEKNNIFNNFACGILYTKNIYYAFLISDINDQYVIENILKEKTLLGLITPILLYYDSENTFIEPESKDEIIQCMIILQLLEAI